MRPVTLLILLLFLRSGSGPALAQEPRDGHEQMVDELSRIAQQEPLTRRFVAGVREARRRLEHLPSRSAQTGHATALRAVAESELRSGMLWEAVGHFEESIDNMFGIRGSAKLRLTLAARYWLGITRLRLARQQLCGPRADPDACLVPLRGADRKTMANAVQAAKQLSQALSLSYPGQPMHDAARWAYNLASMMFGAYPGAVPEELRLDLSAAARAPLWLQRFPNVARSVGLGEYHLAGGLVVDDFDGDGWLDLIASSIDPAAPLQLYRNRGDGTLQRIHTERCLDGITGGVSLVQADYDNDGDLDLFVVRGGGLGADARHPNSLLRNDGAMRFTDVTFEAGLAQVNYPSRTAAWADYDNDGDLDLFVGNRSTGSHAYPSQLFRNDGGVFRDVAGHAGVRDVADTRGASWGDYDSDGFVDLYVANHGSANRLYHNERDGTFRDRAEAAGVLEPRDASGGWFFDADGDDRLDLMVLSERTSSGGPPPVWRFAAVLGGRPPENGGARLYRSRPDGTFLDVSEDWGVSHILFGNAAGVGDLNNDGWQDVMVGTGYPAPESLIPDTMLLNDAGRRFADIGIAGGFAHLGTASAVVLADWDNDGDQDVFVLAGGYAPASEDATLLYRNPGTPNHWVGIELRGTTANRSGVGAVITAVFQDASGARRLVRRMGTAASNGPAPMRVHLGLGTATEIERLEVRWPGQPAAQVLSHLPADRTYRVLQGEAEARPIQPDPPAHQDDEQQRHQGNR